MRLPEVKQQSLRLGGHDTLPCEDCGEISGTFGLVLWFHERDELMGSKPVRASLCPRCLEDLCGSLTTSWLSILGRPIDRLTHLLSHPLQTLT